MRSCPGGVSWHIDPDPAARTWRRRAGHAAMRGWFDRGPGLPADLAFGAGGAGTLRSRLPSAVRHGRGVATAATPFERRYMGHRPTLTLRGPPEPALGVVGRA